LRAAIFAVLSLIGLITVFQHAPPFFLWALATLSGWPGRILLAIIAIVAACVLYYIREANRLYYALMEVTFALVSTWYSVSTLTREPAQWPVVVGSMYLIVRGLDNLKEGYKRRMIEWRRKGMNGTPEEQESFLKQLFHGARFNGRLAILAAPRLKKTHQEVFDSLAADVIPFATSQARDTGYDQQQTTLYVDAHTKAYDSLAEQMGLNAPSWKNS
jgi:hypothetical protein